MADQEFIPDGTFEEVGRRGQVQGKSMSMWMAFVLIGAGFAFLIVGARLLVLSSREARNPTEQRRLRTSAMAFNLIALSCIVLSLII